MGENVKRLLVVAIATAALAASAGPAADPPPDKLQQPQRSAEYADWRDYLLPGAGEQSHRTIPWRASVLRGLIDAQKQDQPILFFLMNGHPLGCS
jgi:hypothetical protein